MVPLDPPPDVANAGEPSENLPTVGPSDAGALRDTANQRVIGEIQRQLGSSRDEFRTCVSVPAGARARITLVVDYDASLRRVSLVQASSSNGTLTLTEQQCLKGIAQRAVRPNNVTAPVRARWSMWIESTTNFERQ